MRYTRNNGSTDAKVKCPKCGTKIKSTVDQSPFPKPVFDSPQEGQLTECHSCQAILEYVEVGIDSLQLRLATARRIRQIRQLDGAPSPLPRLSALVEAARRRRSSLYCLETLRDNRT